MPTGSLSWRDRLRYVGSHFAKEAALAWLSEMHRIVKPGGGLAFSTHGTAAFRPRIRRNPDRREQFIRMWHRRLREGFVFVAPQTGEVNPAPETVLGDILA
jgi:hypothetical protein